MDGCVSLLRRCRNKPSGSEKTVDAEACRKRRENCRLQASCGIFYRSVPGIPQCFNQLIKDLDVWSRHKNAARKKESDAEFRVGI